jgi:ABC-type polysaccharide/polyol phosphate transport system ATPase subunit
MAKINLQSVSVEYPIYNMSTRSFKKHFLRVATGGTVTEDANQHIVVKALNNISLTLEDGDRVGLIGHNGSGKSTMLRLLAGVYEPSQGDIQINGSISAILDLVSSGTELEFTGYENIILRGTLMGLTKKQIKQRLDDIITLTGLGDYLAMPVRTYSSGMVLRLAFAISTSIQPDILLIDEIFNAGDADFTQKAREKMISLLNQSNIVVMATHSNELIEEFCNKAILLEQGKVKFFGSVNNALELYRTKE